VVKVDVGVKVESFVELVKVDIDDVVVKIELGNKLEAFALASIFGSTIVKFPEPCDA
jgi:hypothetical protein